MDFPTYKLSIFEVVYYGIVDGICEVAIWLWNTIVNLGTYTMLVSYKYTMNLDERCFTDDVAVVALENIYYWLLEIIFER